MSEKRDRDDLAQLAMDYLRLIRCPGKRYVVKGYVCGRCGHDYTLDGKCGLRKRPRAALAKARGEG